MSWQISRIFSIKILGQTKSFRYLFRKQSEKHFESKSMEISWQLIRFNPRLYSKWIQTKFEFRINLSLNWFGLIRLIISVQIHLEQDFEVGRNGLEYHEFARIEFQSETFARDIIKLEEKKTFTQVYFR